MAKKFEIEGLELNAVHVPNCPHCQKPTRKEIGLSTTTLMYCPITVDEQGKVISEDYNTSTDEYKCLECKKRYKIKWGRLGNKKTYEYII